MAAGEWDVEIKMKVSEGFKGELLHHPAVVAQITELAQKIVDHASSGHHVTETSKHPFKLGIQGEHPSHFGVHVQNFPKSKHPRAFAMPIDSAGIHLELTQSVLIKAAASVT
jgi:hypothetical protein